MKITYDGSRGSSTALRIPGESKAIIFKSGETKEVSDKIAKKVIEELECFSTKKNRGGK